MNGYAFNPFNMGLASVMAKDLEDPDARKNLMLMGGLMGKSPVSLFVVKSNVEAVAANEETQKKQKTVIGDQGVNIGCLR